MIKALKKKYALSDQGAKNLLKGIVYSVLANISLMFPVILLAIVLNQLLAPVLGASAPEISAAVYTVIGIVILAVVFIFHYCQYTAAYLGTYDESARRRISLAEKLRTLPLTFFHQRDLADLTSTIMGDCANFEHAFSHTVPQFFGAVISTGIVCIGLLIFNWQMGLALLWVAPISFAIVILSRKWQEKLSKKHMNARLELAEGIQECLETVQDTERGRHPVPRCAVLPAQRSERSAPGQPQMGRPDSEKHRPQRGLYWQHGPGKDRNAVV